MKTSRAYAATAITAALVLAGCDEHPATISAPETPSFNGGYTYGSGNRSDTTTATTIAQGSNPATDVAERGGMGYGSGN